MVSDIIINIFFVGKNIITILTFPVLSHQSRVKKSLIPTKPHKRIPDSAVWGVVFPFHNPRSFPKACLYVCFYHVLTYDHLFLACFKLGILGFVAVMIWREQVGDFVSYPVDHVDGFVYVKWPNLSYLTFYIHPPWEIKLWSLNLDPSWTISQHCGPTLLGHS